MAVLNLLHFLFGPIPAIMPLVLNRWPCLLYWKYGCHLSWTLPVLKCLKLHLFPLIQGTKYLSEGVVLHPPPPCAWKHPKAWVATPRAFDYTDEWAWTLVLCMSSLGDCVQPGWRAAVWGEAFHYFSWGTWFPLVSELPILSQAKTFPLQASLWATIPSLLLLFWQKRKRSIHLVPLVSALSLVTDAMLFCENMFLKLPNTLLIIIDEMILFQSLFILSEALHTVKHTLFLWLSGFCIFYPMELVFHHVLLIDWVQASADTWCQ